MVPGVDNIVELEENKTKTIKECSLALSRSKRLVKDRRFDIFLPQPENRRIRLGRGDGERDMTMDRDLERDMDDDKFSDRFLYGQKIQAGTCIQTQTETII